MKTRAQRRSLINSSEWFPVLPLGPAWGRELMGTASLDRRELVFEGFVSYTLKCSEKEVG